MSDVERSYRRLRMVVDAVEGFFALILVESTLDADQREQLFDRLRRDIGPGGRQLVVVALAAQGDRPRGEIAAAAARAGSSPVVVVSNLRTMQSGTRSRHDARSVLHRRDAGRLCRA